VKEDKNNIVYKLPDKRKVINQNPVDRRTYLAFDVKDYPPLPIIKFNDIYMTMFTREFKRFGYDIKKKSLVLFVQVSKTKKLALPGLYFNVCLCLCLPFWYKLDKIFKRRLYTLYFSTNSPSLINYLENIESDIWNMFGNILPIETVVV
jgi:hypothetical protein